MGDITKYLEGQYDGTGLQRSVQQMGDLQRAREMEQRVEETQRQLWEREESRIAQIYGVSETDRYGVGNLMKAYDEEDRYNEYLVHGAVLWCDQATLEDFELPDGEKVVLEENPEISNEERCQSIMEVWENPMSVNGKTYATVRDTIKDANVIPFRCNCKQKVNRDAEVERIQSDPECGKYGVCRHLMQLNEKWDNMPRKTGYMKLKDGIPNTTEGVADVLGSDSGLWVAEEGITMTSVLFCKHGGLIRAIRSGQEAESRDAILAEAYSVMTIWTREGYSSVSEQELLEAMLCMARYGNQDNISALNLLDDDMIEELKRNLIEEGVTIKKEDEDDFYKMCERINDSVKRQEKYDDMILAWTNYWNMTMESEFGIGNYAPVRADVVKAMLVVETNMGQESNKGNVIANGYRDIKQALDCRNPVIWTVMDEYGAGRTVTIVYAEEDVAKFDIESMQTITVKRNLTDGGDGNRLFFGNGEWGVVKNLFSENYDMFYAGRVTPEMSLAVGVGWYCMKLNGCGQVNEGESLNRSEERAATDYNGGGDLQYTWKTNIVLKDMGVDVLGRANE